MPRLYQGNFNAGELSPDMWGRIESDRYQSGVRVGRNVFFRPEGGVVRRPGLEYIGYGLAGLTIDAKFIPFKFNNEQTYMLVAQPDNIYFIKDGGVILDDIDQFTSAAVDTGTTGSSLDISVGNDATGVYVNFNTGTHSYTANTRIFWLQGGYDQLEGRWLKVAPAGITATRFYVYDFLTNDYIDGSAFSTNVRTIDFGRIYNLNSANNWYTSVDVSELDWTQANDTLYISHPDDATKVITRGATDTSWTITDFDPNPSVSAPTAVEDTLVIAPPLYDNLAVTKPSGTDVLDYAVTAVDNTTYEESLATEFQISTIDLASFAGPPDTGTGAVIAVTHQSGADTYFVYRAIGGIYGLIGKVQMTSGTSYFSDIGYTPNLSIAPPLEVNPKFNAADEYPGAVELFQERSWFGRTNTELRDLYASRSGSFSSFASTTVATDDDPISQKIAARSVHELRYFLPLRNLVVLTSDGVWGFDTGQDGALTPSAGLISQNFWGSARVKPALVGDAAIYVEQSGRSVRDLAFSLQNDGFASSDLTLLSKHLFAGREVVSMCYAENPYQVLFCVMSDGTAVSCTYVRDQQIFAWARHDTRGKMLDCASITEGGRDNIYVFVERSGDDTIAANFRWRQIERMVMVDPIFSEQGMYLDNSEQLEPGIAWTSDAEELYYPRIDDGNFQVQLLDTTPNDSLVRLHELGGPLQVLEDVTFLVDDTGVDQTGGVSGYDWYNLYRHDSGDVSTRELFDWEGYFPDEFIEWDQVGVYSYQEDLIRKMYRLYWRGGVLTVRTEGDYLENQTLNENGVLSLASEHALIQVGEPYISEIETLDIDDPNDPVTGLPIQIGSVLLRFALAKDFKIGRNRGTNALYHRMDLEAEEDYDTQLGAFVGVIEQNQLPRWNRSGRVIVRTEAPFPWKLTAIILQVEAGDVDA